MKRLTNIFYFTIWVLLITALASCSSPTNQSPHPPTQLTGNPTAPATSAIPRISYESRIEDFSDDHPELGSLMVSFNTVALVFTLETTVGEANAVLADMEALIVGGIPGMAGQIEGILFLRVPTENHLEMIDLLARLEANPNVKHVVQDSLMEVPEPELAELKMMSIPEPDGNPPGWSWELTPSGGNFGLELIRMPQLWNLNAAIGAASPVNYAGVLDVGFTEGHEDLSTITVNLSPGIHNDHGAHVAGIIAATYHKGVAGISPFTNLVVRAASAPTGADASMANQRGWGAVQFGLYDLIRHPSVLNVINISMGYSWGNQTPPKNADTDVSLQTYITIQGAIFAQLLQLVVSEGHELPLLVVSAGNSGGQEARWNSAWNNAALVHGVPNILVIESVANQPGTTGGATRSSFSNIGGTMSAPGGEFDSLNGQPVLSTCGSRPYCFKQGTSMAAPHITGLVSYLYSLEPTLTHAEVRDLLLRNSVPVAGGASPRIDAFATVMDIDRIRNNRRVLKLLLDIDDGTLDGNTRIELATGQLFYGDSGNDFGPVGDGRIDMKDFRRWRDWLLQAENHPDLQLDGDAQHPKKDLNGDGFVGTPEQENIYPRGDFNGDGILSRNECWEVPNISTPAGSPCPSGLVTDLDLFIASGLWQDPLYNVTDLRDLIDSADLTVDVSEVFSQHEAVRVVVALRPSGTNTALYEWTHTPAEPSFVYTAKLNPDGYQVKLEAFNSSNASILTLEEEYAFDELGADYYWGPEARQDLQVEADFPSTVQAGVMTPLVVRAGYPDEQGAIDYQPGIEISLSAVGGTVVPISGLTNAQGALTATVTLAQGESGVTVTITATDPETGAMAETQVSAGAPGGVTVGFAGVVLQAWSRGHCSSHELHLDYFDDQVREESLEVTTSASSTSAVSTVDRAGRPMSARGSSTVNISVQPTFGGAGQLASVTGNANASGEYASTFTEERDGYCIGDSKFVIANSITFTITGQPTAVRLTGSVNSRSDSSSYTRYGIYDERNRRSVFGQTSETGSSFEETVTLVPGDYTFSIETHGNSFASNAEGTIEGSFSYTLVFE